MKRTVACHENDELGSKVVARMVELLAAPNREYHWHRTEGYRIGHGLDPTMPQIVIGPADHDLAAPIGKPGEEAVLVTTYRPEAHHTFSRCKPKNLFSLFMIMGGSDAPTLEGFRSIVFLRNGVPPHTVVSTAASQALHVFFTMKQKERFRNCSQVTVDDLVAPERRYRRSARFVDDARASAAI